MSRIGFGEEKRLTADAISFQGMCIGNRLGEEPVALTCTYKHWRKPARDVPYRRGQTGVFEILLAPRAQKAFGVCFNKREPGIQYRLEVVHPVEQQQPLQTYRRDIAAYPGFVQTNPAFEGHWHTRTQVARPQNPLPGRFGYGLRRMPPRCDGSMPRPARRPATVRFTCRGTDI